MAVVECLKIYVKYSKTTFNLVFTLNIYREKVARTFWAYFFGRLYRSNGTKIQKYIWMRCCY